jgi:hypothetical protein
MAVTLRVMMRKFWRKNRSFPSITKSSVETSKPDLAEARESVEQVIRSLGQLEKQLTYVELKLESEPGSCRSLAYPCARLEVKLLEMQNHLAKVMTKLSRLV